MAGAHRIRSSPRDGGTGKKIPPSGRGSRFARSEGRIGAPRQPESRRSWLNFVAYIVAVPCLTGLTGCIESGITALNPVPSYSKPLSRTSNLLDRSLADCPTRNETEEAKCVRKGLIDAGISVTDLVAMIPNCQSGQMCRYSYTTHDRLGFLQSYASELTIHWQVTFDLRHASALAADVPIAVTEVNV